jgi:hypothetical protein
LALFQGGKSIHRKRCFRIFIITFHDIISASGTADAWSARLNLRDGARSLVVASRATSAEGSRQFDVTNSTSNGLTSREKVPPLSRPFSGAVSAAPGPDDVRADIDASLKDEVLNHGEIHGMNFDIAKVRLFSLPIDSNWSQNAFQCRIIWPHDIAGIFPAAESQPPFPLGVYPGA